MFDFQRASNRTMGYAPTVQPMRSYPLSGSVENPEVQCLCVQCLRVCKAPQLPRSGMAVCGVRAPVCGQDLPDDPFGIFSFGAEDEESESESGSEGEAEPANAPVCRILPCMQRDLDRIKRNLECAQGKTTMAAGARSCSCPWSYGSLL